MTIRATPLICAPILIIVQAASGIVFTSTRNHNKAVQAVHVTAVPPKFAPRLPDIPSPELAGREVASSSSSSSEKGSSTDRSASAQGDVSPQAGCSSEGVGGDALSDAVSQGGYELVSDSNGSGRWKLGDDLRSGSSDKPRRHTFTFCLERVDEGALKGIWYTVGVRVGDYSV